MGGVALAAWALIFALPFATAVWLDPANAPLTAEDRGEYVEADSSGYTLGEVAAYLVGQAGESRPAVVGVLANCGGLRHYLGGALTMECPTLTIDGRSMPGIAAQISILARQGGLWVVFEPLSYTNRAELGLAGEPTAVFARPGGRTRLEVFRVK